MGDEVSAVNQIREYCEAKGLRYDYYAGGVKLLDDKNKIVYSVIPDHLSSKWLETWDFVRGSKSYSWRTIDSVKRSIRRLLNAGIVARVA